MLPRLAIKPLTRLPEMQKLAQQVLHRQFAPPARYGTAFHIRPPVMDVRELPQPAQRGRAAVEDFETLAPADRQRMFQLLLASDAYLAWLVAHLDAIDTRIIHVQENETRSLQNTEHRTQNKEHRTQGSLLFIFLETGAKLDMTDIVAGASIGLRRMFVWQKEASHFSYMGLRATTQFWNERLRVELLGRGAAATVTHLTHTQGVAQSDIGVQVNHQAPATCNVGLRAAAAGRGTAVYRGLIDIAKEAGGSQGYQAARGLVASEKAVVDILPELEIKTNDVRCSHGVNITHLDEAALFYMRARGLSEAQARRLALLGFYSDGLEIPAHIRKDLRSVIYA